MIVTQGNRGSNRVAGRTLRRAQDILDKYLARTSKLAEGAIAKFENVIAADFAKRTAK